jgi:transposase
VGNRVANGRSSAVLSKGAQNNTIDAEAICEAMRRFNMRFVGVRNAKQQTVLMIHRCQARVHHLGDIAEGHPRIDRTRS